MNEKVRPLIVVADDDLDVCELLDMQLRHSDYEVHIALGGMQALEIRNGNCGYSGNSHDGRKA